MANFLNVPKFHPTIHKCTKQFGFSFAFDPPTVWNSLPEEIRASPTIATFRKKLKTYLYAKAYPPLLIFSYGFSVVLTYFCPWTLNLHIAIVLLRLRVHYSVEIKRYKSRIRIRVTFNLISCILLTAVTKEICHMSVASSCFVVFFSITDIYTCFLNINGWCKLLIGLIFLQ